MNILLIALPIISGLLALLLIAILSPLARSLRLLDEPVGRKQHGMPVPMVGGISIYFAVLATFLVINPPEKLSWLISSGSIIVLIGFLDDVFNLSVKARFFAQIIAAIVMLVGADLWIDSLGIDWFGFDSLGIVGILVTIIAVVGLTNAFNMSDGIDGLASGHSLVCLILVSATMKIVHGSVLHFQWIMVWFSACLAFWLVNMTLTPFKRVFLGDAGSLYLGFVISWLLVYYTQQPVSQLKPVAAIWFVAVPVIDTLIVMWRRLSDGKSPFAPDRNHFHHLLVDRGFSSLTALVVIMVISIVINTLGLLATYFIGEKVGLLLFLFTLIGFGYVVSSPRRFARVALYILRDPKSS